MGRRIYQGRSCEKRNREGTGPHGSLRILGDALVAGANSRAEAGGRKAASDPLTEWRTGWAGHFLCHCYFETTREDILAQRHFTGLSDIPSIEGERYFRLVAE